MLFAAGMEFGWWTKDPEKGKFQVRALFHGSNLSWESKHARFTSWVTHAPTLEDWNLLILNAENRYNRRLLSPRQLQDIRDIRQRVGPGPSAT